MTTILPEKNKKEIKKEYLFGFLAKLFSGLCFVVFFAIIFQVTVYFIVDLEKNYLEKKFQGDEIKKREEVFNNYKNILTDTNKVIKMFSENKNTKQEVLDFILLLNDDYNFFTSITIENSEGGEFVKVSGISKDRSSLVKINSFLENSSNVSSIQLPASSFTKTFDIPFSLSFIYKYE